MRTTAYKYSTTQIFLHEKNEKTCKTTKQLRKTFLDCFKSRNRYATCDNMCDWYESITDPLKCRPEWNEFTGAITNIVKQLWPPPSYPRNKEVNRCSCIRTVTWFFVLKFQKHVANETSSPKKKKKTMHGSSQKFRSDMKKDLAIN